MFQSVNPATGAIVAEYEPVGDREIDQVLGAAETGFRAWRDTGFAERGAVFKRYAEALRGEADALALIAAREMGKPVSEGRAEVEKCAWLCEHYADNAEALLAPETHDVDDAEVILRHEPLGVVFSVTPWNFPFWQLLRAAIPPLAAGDAVVNKPASNVIGCAKAVVDLFAKSGGPEGVFQTFALHSSKAADVIADGRVAAVALTGSEGAGAAVASAAGKALKPSLLELGGSDPFIVLADADIAKAAEAAAASRFKNAGQVCIASKRFIVEAPARRAFEEAFIEASKAYKPADPEKDDTKLGPMARGDLRKELAEQVERSIARGAKVLKAGGIVEGPGFYYDPAILGDGPDDSPAAKDETFGPAALIVTARDAGDAVRIANQTSFGLSSNLWTADIDRAKALAPKIEAGGVYVNTVTASDPRFPFGGIKRSGYGRELGEAGIKEFTNLKTLRIAR